MGLVKQGQQIKEKKKQYKRITKCYKVLQSDSRLDIGRPTDGWSNGSSNKFTDRQTNRQTFLERCFMAKSKENSEAYSELLIAFQRES